MQTKLFSLKYIEDYWKLSWLVASCPCRWWKIGITVFTSVSKLRELCKVILQCRASKTLTSSKEGQSKLRATAPLPYLRAPTATWGLPSITTPCKYGLLLTVPTSSPPGLCQQLHLSPRAWNGVLVSTTGPRWAGAHSIVAATGHLHCGLITVSAVTSSVLS